MKKITVGLGWYDFTHEGREWRITRSSKRRYLLYLWMGDRWDGFGVFRSQSAAVREVLTIIPEGE